MRLRVRQSHCHSLTLCVNSDVDFNEVYGYHDVHALFRHYWHNV